MTGASNRLGREWAAVAGVVLGLTACDAGTRCAPATLSPLASEARFAVVTSDYTSTALALLDRSGALVREAWIDSGTTTASLTATLSGDVVLPSEPLGPHVLTLIDRFQVDVITRIALPSGRVLDQTPAQGLGAGGFRSNPQDVILVADDALLVSRHEANLDPEASEHEQGNDLVVVRPGSTGVERRYDLSVANTYEDGREILARPSRLVALGAGVVVGLARLDRSFQHPGRGAVAVVSLESGAVSVLELEGLENCGEAARGVGHADDVVVLCAGATFGDTEARRATAGIAWIAVEGGAASLRALWRAADHAGLLPPSLGPVPVSADAVVVAALGDARRPDELLWISRTEPPALVHRAVDPFVLGRGVRAPEGDRLLVPDASRGVLLFPLRDGRVRGEPEATTVSPCRGLGAREIGLLGGDERR